MSSEQHPNFDHEQQLWNDGCLIVAGIDEAGRGALAGPVVAAAVVVPCAVALSGVWLEVRDSKLLTPIRREELEPRIKDESASWSVGSASNEEIDATGIAPATRVAMMRAVDGLTSRPEHLLIDWVRLPRLNIAQTCWAKADRYCVSVAAASVLAKVHRDRLLVEIDAQYPDYGFAAHKGYGTDQHRLAITRYGPCPAHRFTFAPIAQRNDLFDSIGATS